MPKKVLAMYYYEKFQLDEIATALGPPEYEVHQMLPRHSVLCKQSWQLRSAFNVKRQLSTAADSVMDRKARWADQNGCKTTQMAQ